MVEKLNNLSKEELVSEVILAKNENAYLKHQISLYQKALFGNKKEEHKVIDSKQTEIAFEEKVDLDLPGDIELQQISYHRKKGKKKREDFSKLSLPDDLERVITVIEPEGLTDDMERIDYKYSVLAKNHFANIYLFILKNPEAINHFRV